MGNVAFGVEDERDRRGGREGRRGEQRGGARTDRYLCALCDLSLPRAPPPPRRQRSPRPQPAYSGDRPFVLPSCTNLRLRQRPPRALLDDIIVLDWLVYSAPLPPELVPHCRLTGSPRVSSPDAVARSNSGPPPVSYLLPARQPKAELFGICRHLTAYPELPFAGWCRHYVQQDVQQEIT